MRQVAGQQVVAVVFLQVVAYLGHHVVGNDCAFLDVAFDLDVREPGARILIDVSPLCQVGAEAPQPGEVVVPRDERVVPLDIDIVQEARYHVVVHLEHVYQVSVFIGPCPEHIQVADITCYSVLTQATVVQPLIKVVVIQVGDCGKERVCQRVRVFDPWVPPSLELAHEIPDHVAGRPLHLGLRPAVVEHVFFALPLAGGRIKGIETDEGLLSDDEPWVTVPLYFIVSGVWI